MNRLLTPRLLEIASLVSQGAALIDVGTDHAYIPIYLMHKGVLSRGKCTDIHDGPIQRAKENISRYGLTDKIITEKADGLQGVDVEGFDTIVIAGMGGMLIAEILRNAPFLQGKTLILQPMTAVRELRMYLLENGFFISTERIVKEVDKYYSILVASLGKEEMYSPLELLLGRKSVYSPYFGELKKRELERLIKKRDGLLSGKNKSSQELNDVLSLIEELNKYDNKNF